MKPPKPILWILRNTWLCSLEEEKAYNNRRGEPLVTENWKMKHDLNCCDLREGNFTNKSRISGKS